MRWPGPVSDRAKKALKKEQNRAWYEKQRAKGTLQEYIDKKNVEVTARRAAVTAEAIREGNGRDIRLCQRRRLTGFRHLPIEQRPFYCRCYRRTGSPYCGKHDNRQKTTGRMWRTIPVRYRVIGKRMMQRLMELQEEADQFSLLDELALHRAAADDVVQLFAQAGEEVGRLEEAIANWPAETEEPPPKELTDQLTQAQLLKAKAAEKMFIVFESVRETALDAARIETLTKGFYSATAVRSIIQQCVGTLAGVCESRGGLKDIVDEFERQLRVRVRLDAGPAGTTLTPDMDAMDMDSTVPRAGTA